MATSASPRPAGAPPVNVPAQGVQQLRQQVNISQQQQQRIGSPLNAGNIAGSARIANQQQLLQQQARVLQQQQQQMAQAQAQAQAADKSTDNSQPMTGVVSAQIPTTGYVSRDATSSPAHSQASPPRTSATPSNAISPRPPSAQAVAHAQQLQAQVVGANGLPRATNMNGHFYIPNVTANSLPNPNLTPQQYNEFLRISVRYLCLAQI